MAGPDRVGPRKVGPCCVLARVVPISRCFQGSAIPKLDDNVSRFEGKPGSLFLILYTCPLFVCRLPVVVIFCFFSRDFERNGLQF